MARPTAGALLLIFVTSFWGVHRWRRCDWLWVVLFLLPFLALRTRGPVLWGILALIIFYLFYKTRLQDRILQAGVLFVIGVGAYIYRSENVLQTIFGPLIPYLTRGDTQSTMALTGRVPLWQVLIEEVGRHPWLGAGFTAFWSSRNIFRVERLAGFSAVSAHNGYLEELLNTGVVGLTILLTFCLGTLVVARRWARRGDPLGWLVFLFMVFYLLLNTTNALTQEYFELPFVIVLVALALMASTPATDPPTLPPTAPDKTVVRRGPSGRQEPFDERSQGHG